MAIRNSYFSGGTDWSPGDVFAAADINDTLDELYDQGTSYTDTATTAIEAYAGRIRLLGSSVLGGSNANIEVTGLTTTDYDVIIFDLVGDTAATANLQLRLNGDTGGSSYSYVYWYDNSGTWTKGEDNANSNITLGPTASSNNEVGITGRILQSGSHAKRIFAKTSCLGVGNIPQYFTTNGVHSSTRVTAIRLIASGSTFATGTTLRVYGLKNS